MKSRGPGEGNYKKLNLVQRCNHSGPAKGSNYLKIKVLKSCSDLRKMSKKPDYYSSEICHRHTSQKSGFSRLFRLTNFVLWKNKVFPKESLAPWHEGFVLVTAWQLAKTMTTAIHPTDRRPSSGAGQRQKWPPPLAAPLSWRRPRSSQALYTQSKLRGARMPLASLSSRQPAKKSCRSFWTVRMKWGVIWRTAAALSQRIRMEGGLEGQGEVLYQGATVVWSQTQAPNTPPHPTLPPNQFRKKGKVIFTTYSLLLNRIIENTL